MTRMNGEQGDPRLGKTSASGAEADTLCPGRHRAQQAARAVLQKEPDPTAEFGDAVHDALAQGDSSKLDPEQSKTYDLCLMVEEDILKRYFGSDFKEAVSRQWRHRRFWGVFGGFEHSGEPDVVYRHQGKALIIDYKTLFGDYPSASSNLQLRDYAVLANEHFMLLEEIATVVDQPHITLKPEICVYKKDDLVRAKGEMTERIIRSNSADAPRVAGNVQCQFCEAKTLCKEYSLWAASKVPVVQGLAETPMAEWTPDMWSVFCGNMFTAYKWLELGKEEAKRRLKADPESIPGFFLREGRKVRHVVKPNELYARFEKLGGTREDFMNCVEITLGRLENELRNLTNAKGKALEKAMEAVLAGLIAIEESEPSIAKKKE